MRLRAISSGLLSAIVLTFSVGNLQAQTATDLNEGLQLVKNNSTEVFTLSWWAKSGRTYFVQTSLDLVTWTYLPLVENHVDTVAGIGFTNTEDRQFWRLRYTDADTNGNAETADFDGDGVQNLIEVTIGTDPFVAEDTDMDGIPDDWEKFKFGTLDRDLSLDTDGDGVSDYDEWGAGTDPRDWRSHPGAEGEVTVLLSVYTPLVK